MRQRAGIVILGAFLLGACALVDTGAAVAQGKPAPEKAVAEQKAAAQGYWKAVFDKDAPLIETKHFLVCGAAPGQTLVQAGASLEKVYDMVRKVLEIGPKEEPWPGKLAVYLAPDIKGFNALVRKIERRLTEEGERSLYVVRSDTPHVLAGPGKDAADLSVDGEAASQVASALLAAKFSGVPLPEWVVEGFGRATALLAGAPEALTAEHERANTLVANKHAAKEAWSGDLKAQEAAVLRASLVEYIAYSGRSAKFLPLLNAFRPGENQQNVPTDAALAAINVAPDRLNIVWQKWVRTLK